MRNSLEHIDYLFQEKQVVATNLLQKLKSVCSEIKLHNFRNTYFEQETDCPPEPANPL
jgi:hypothetical protein